MGDFPNEILLQVFSFLPLKSLITSRTVSQEWRRLIPLADITPIRRALLDFYLTLIDSPIFPQTRPWVLANLQPFDRQQYIDNLMSHHPCFSEAFCVWILEWPAKAVIGCVWPGLPNVECARQDADNVHRIEGANELKPGPHFTIHTLSKPSQKGIYALCIFNNPQSSTFLLLDERQRFRDQVITSTEHLENYLKWDEPDVDWIGWQKRTWGKIEEAAKIRAQRGLGILQLEDTSPYKEEDDNQEQES